MGALRNPKHEQYARHRALLVSKPEAAKLAGYRNLRNTGRLEKDERIRARIRELIKADEEQIELDVANMRRELRDIGYGEAMDDLKYAHKLTALDQLAKLLGIEKPAKLEFTGSGAPFVVNIVRFSEQPEDAPQLPSPAE